MSFTATAWSQTTFIGSGNWSDPANWDNGVPTNSTSVTINGNCTVDINPAECGNITINMGAFFSINTGSVLQVGGDVLSFGDISVAPMATLSAANVTANSLMVDGILFANNITSFSVVNGNGEINVFGTLDIMSPIGSTYSGRLNLAGMGSQNVNLNLPANQINFMGNGPFVLSGMTFFSSSTMVNLNSGQIQTDYDLVFDGLLYADFSSSISATNGTIRYPGGSVIAGTYSGLNISGSASLLGDITVNGALAVQGGNLNLNSFNLTINGTVDNFSLGTISASGGTVTYATTATTIIAGTYNDLVINGDAVLGGDVVVNGTLTINGVVSLGNNNLTLNGAVTGGSATAYINANGTGQIVKSLAAAPLVNYLIPTGTGGKYRPVTFNLSAYTGTGSITVANVASVATNLKHAR